MNPEIKLIWSDFLSCIITSMRHIFVVHFAQCFDRVIIWIELGDPRLFTDPKRAICLALVKLIINKLRNPKFCLILRFILR